MFFLPSAAISSLLSSFWIFRNQKPKSRVHQRAWTHKHIKDPARQSFMLSATLRQQQKLKTGLRIGMRIPQVAVLASSFLTSGSQGFSMSSSTVSSAPSWADVEASVGKTEVGQALDKENKLRSTGQGSAHVYNKLRLFDSKEDSPAITFFRDQAAWCPYCQNTMLLIEEKKFLLKLSWFP